MLLRHGSDGVPKDVLGAKQLFEYAAVIGHIEAMNDLGVLLHEGGNGIPTITRALNSYLSKPSVVVASRL